LLAAPTRPPLMRCERGRALYRKGGAHMVALGALGMALPKA
jgi:hypothetical protein